jgi:hypothetical protein
LLWSNRCNRSLTGILYFEYLLLHLRLACRFRLEFLRGEPSTGGFLALTTRVALRMLLAPDLTAQDSLMRVIRILLYQRVGGYLSFIIVTLPRIRILSRSYCWCIIGTFILLEEFVILIGDLFDHLGDFLIGAPRNLVQLLEDLSTIEILNFKGLVLLMSAGIVWVAPG